MESGLGAWGYVWSLAVLTYIHTNSGYISTGLLVSRYVVVILHVYVYMCYSHTHTHMHMHRQCLTGSCAQASLYYIRNHI